MQVLVNIINIFRYSANVINMFWSSEEIENRGTITNSVTVANAITLDHNDALYILYFIAFVKLIELFYIVYKSVVQNVKRRMQLRQNQI